MSSSGLSSARSGWLSAWPLRYVQFPPTINTARPRSGWLSAWPLRFFQSIADEPEPDDSQWLALRLAIAFGITTDASRRLMILAVVGSPLGHCVEKSNSRAFGEIWLAVVGSPLGHCVCACVRARIFDNLVSQWLALRLAIALPYFPHMSNFIFGPRSGWLSAWPLRFSTKNSSAGEFEISQWLALRLAIAFGYTEPRMRAAAYPRSGWLSAWPLRCQHGKVFERCGNCSQWLALRLAIALSQTQMSLIRNVGSQWLALRLAIALSLIIVKSFIDFFLAVVGSPLGHCVFGRLPYPRRGIRTRSGWLSAWPLRFFNLLAS